LTGTTAPLLPGELPLSSQRAWRGMVLPRISTFTAAESSAAMRATRGEETMILPVALSCRERMTFSRSTVMRL